ncbi:extracellular solute-binding protein [Paenibacillus spongiae]|uniref:Extracellular solute-binding protein n=1 Tax=Paenibacillus spongiae TaxID=2909671 RepID=A0ABY5SKJ2_9BACL|nr:extracellular solute-binding protein [Paenibacillus spongiae]UVI33190.1 extracellular solute-binding protein [Paenibacillus spongiae]
MNHRLYRFFVVLVISVFVVTACSSSPSSKEEEGGEKKEAVEKDKESFVADIKLLRAWGGIEEFNKLVEDFNKDYPNIKVEVMEQAYTDLPALIAAGIVPDLVGMVGHMPEWVENGVLEELTDYIEVDPQVNPDTFYEVAYKRSITPDGKIWGLPWLVDPNFALMVNKTILDEYGITEVPELNTLQDVGNFLRNFWVVRDGKQVMTTFKPHDETYNPVNSLQTWSYANGAYTTTFYNPETRKVSFNDPKIVEALEWIVQFKRENIDDARLAEIQSSLPEGMNRFQAGKAAVMVQTAGDLRNHYKLNPEEIEIIPMPKQSIWAGGWSFGMTAGGKNKEAAWEFLKWITATNEGAESTLKHFSVLSGKAENPYLDEQAKTDPVYAAFKDVLKSAERGHLWTWIPVDWTGEFIAKWSEVMNGNLEPKAFLDHMTTYIQALIDEKYKP